MFSVWLVGKMLYIGKRLGMGTIMLLLAREEDWKKENRMKRKLKWCLSHKDSLLPKSRKKSEKWETKRWSRGVWVLWQIKSRKEKKSMKKKAVKKKTSQRVWVCAYAVSRKWHEKNWWEKLLWSGWQILDQQINWAWRAVWECLDFKRSSQNFGCRHLQ